MTCLVNTYLGFMATGLGQRTWGDQLVTVTSYWVEVTGKLSKQKDM